MDKVIRHYDRNGCRIIAQFANFDYSIEWDAGKENEFRPAWDEAKYGRGSIMIDEDLVICINHQGGSYPRIRELGLIMAANPDGLVAITKALQFKRKNPYKVEFREGPSGARDYRFVSATPHGNVYVKDVKCRVHISMNDKFNEHDVRKGVFLPDLVVILCMHDEWFAQGASELWKNEYTIGDINDRVNKLAEKNGITIKYYDGSTMTESDIRNKENGWMID